MISEEDERLEVLRVGAACAECGIDDTVPFFSIHRRTFFGKYEELAENIFKMDKDEADEMKKFLAKEFDCTRLHLMVRDAKLHEVGIEHSTVSDLAKIFRLGSDKQYRDKMLSIYRQQILPAIEKYRDAGEAELRLLIGDFREKIRKKQEVEFKESYGE